MQTTTNQDEFGLIPEQPIYMTFLKSTAILGLQTRWRQIQGKYMGITNQTVSMNQPVVGILLNNGHCFTVGNVGSLYWELQDGTPVSLHHDKKPNLIVSIARTVEPTQERIVHIHPPWSHGTWEDADFILSDDPGLQVDEENCRCVVFPSETWGNVGIRELKIGQFEFALGILIKENWEAFWEDPVALIKKCPVKNPGVKIVLS